MSEWRFVIEVMGRPYTIRFSEATTSSSSHMGQSCNTKAEIWVRQDMDSFGQRQTLLHELIHAIGDDCSLDLTETQVSVIANGLATIRELSLELRGVDLTEAGPRL
jgi:hypothetical protein